MPGKKSLKKIEKQQRTKDKDRKSSKDRTDKIIGSIETSDMSSDDVISSLKRMKAITPTEVASQFNLKISIAKKMLRELADERTLDLVAKSHNLEVYAFPQD